MTSLHTPAFVYAFREAAPYIHAFRNKTFVIAFGGELLETDRLAPLCYDLNVLISLGVRVVLVHGIRPQIDAVLATKGIVSRYHGSRRITDGEGLAAVRQAVGLARAEIESQLSLALPNSPMAGANLRISSGNFVVARPLGVLDGVDMQYTGQVRRIDVQAIRDHLALGEIVLFSPLGFSPTGESFNLTMEELATDLAVNLQADKLIFLADSDGVHSEDGTFLAELTAGEAEQLLEEKELTPGSLWTYLACATRATRKGVARAHLVSHREEGALLTELFTHDGIGTMISRENLVKMRTATIDDVGAILALIEPLEQRGALVKRGRELIEMEIQHYFVVEHDGMIIGCVAMHPDPKEQMAELACLAVDPQWRDGGYGDALVQQVERQARAKGVAKLFVLTTQTAHWFVEHGFVLATPEALPEAKKAFYNHQRRSQVLIKTLS